MSKVPRETSAGPMLTTYAVECAECGDTKWPTLAERPERYVCVLCRAVSPEQRVKMRETGKRSASTRKSRQALSQDVTGAAG